MKTKIAAGDWVVVCDGRKALILENEGDEKFPNLRMKHVREHGDATTHEMGVSPPVRVQTAHGPTSSVEQTDWHDQAEQQFLSDLAGYLDSTIQAGAPRKFVVVAAPRALGMLRHVLSPAVKHAIALEIDKDWVKMPIHEIERHLTA